MGCHSCPRREGSLEAHGRRRSGRAAVAIEDWERGVVSLREVGRRMVMRLRAMTAAARGVGTAAEDIAAAAAAVEEVVVVDIAQATESV